MAEIYDKPIPAQNLKVGDKFRFSSKQVTEDKVRREIESLQRRITSLIEGLTELTDYPLLKVTEVNCRIFTIHPSDVIVTYERQDGSKDSLMMDYWSVVYVLEVSK